MGHDADGHDEHGRALDPAFDRHVLDHLPTPIVVVDQVGTIVYGNASAARTMRLTLDDASSLSRPVEVNGVAIAIAASIGVAIAPPDTDLDVLLASADAAMYEATPAGGAGHRITLVD